MSFTSQISPPRDYLPASPSSIPPSSSAGESSPGPTIPDSDALHAAITKKGYVFEPWQIAAFVTAVRTKPFVVLAGISGTGKTKLPMLVADLTGASFTLIPVQPSWTDSSELLGYERLDGTFKPGPLLELCRDALLAPDRQFFVVLDEMNIARVEYYFAEVLSHIEMPGLASPLVRSGPSDAPDAKLPWSKVTLPTNLCIVGTVNMDESTFGFSRKVLDRSFVIEFSDIDLNQIGQVDADAARPASLSASSWRPRARTLAEDDRVGNSPVVGEITSTLESVNEILGQAQLQVGYRVRDEIVMFCLNSEDAADAFTTTDGGVIDSLDIAISMKILPRIQGSGSLVGAILESLSRWAQPDRTDSEQRAFPMCADRINLMIRRLDDLGFASYWL